MAKIKFKLWRTGETLCFQVLDMDERFRNADAWTSEKTKVRICSAAWPEIDFKDGDRDVYLWGSEVDNDHDVYRMEFDSVAEAIRAQADIIAALEDWAENWTNFESDGGEHEVFEF